MKHALFLGMFLALLASLRPVTLSTMPANHKLTKLLRGRTLQNVQPQPDAATPTLAATFDDGSMMKVKTGEIVPLEKVAPRGKVWKTRQNETMLTLDFEDETLLQLPLAEPTSSVMLRDKDGVLEYAD